VKYIVQYLLAHFRAHASWPFWLIFGLGLAGAVWLRYGYGFSPNFTGSPLRPLWGLLFCAFPYFGAILLYAVCFGQWDFWRQPGFWALSAGILAVLWFNQYGLFYKAWLEHLPALWYTWARKLSFNLHTTLFYLLVPGLWYWWAGQGRDTHFWGCTTQGFYWQVYGLMLLIMVPLIAWASFRADFLHTYPRYRPGALEAAGLAHPLLTVGGYQVSYVVQFVALEIFFRGFMVMSLARYLGGGAVFPMVAVYCFLHFFKPMPETIGSIFGGYILGVIALFSRSTLGGMMAHVGVALLMELFAFFQLVRGKD
jgi:hypothetical protein